MAFAAEHLAMFAQLVKVLKVLEARTSAIDAELFPAATWGSFGNWLGSTRRHLQQFSLNKNPALQQQANDLVDSILGVLKPIDAPAAPEMAKAISEAAEAFQAKIIEELERVRAKDVEIKAQVESLGKDIDQGKARLNRVASRKQFPISYLKPIRRAIIVCGIIWGVAIPSGVFAQRNALSAAADRPERPATVTSPTPDKMKAGDAVGQGYLEDYSGLGIEMKWIPKGHFEMGSKLTADEVASKLGGKKEWYGGEFPAHRVDMDGFWMGKTEVTVGQFRRFVERTGYKTDAEIGGGAWDLVGGYNNQKKDASWQNPGFSQGDDHPVVSVSWNDATKFCEWLSKESGGKKYRLPTEAQWEYSAREGNKGIFPWGDDPSGGKGWANVADQAAKRKFNWFLIFDFDDGYVYTAPVGSFQANGFGLKDVIGNAAEWCRDWYDADYYARSSGPNPENTTPGEYRVLRGGAWHPHPGYCRPSYRGWSPPALAYYHFGFRVSRTPNP